MKNKNIILLFVIMTISVSINIALRPLNDLDEVWNFNFAKCISNGMVPYKDISMVMTPLSSFMLAVILCIFGKELFVMRIGTIILAISILLIIYKILKEIQLSKNVSIILVMFICINYIELFAYDYNFLLIVFVLLIIYLEIKNINQRKSLKLNFIIGLIAGLSVLTKQTVGSICLVITILNGIWLINDIKDFKHYIKILSVRIIGSIIPIYIFIIYLMYNNAVGDFLNYCILGISTFSNKISYLNLIINYDIKVCALSIVVPIILIIYIVKNIIKKPKTAEQMYIYILLLYSVCSFVLVFPISDVIHFMIGCLPTLILIIYLVNLKLKEENSNIDIKWKKVALVYMVIVIIFFDLLNIVSDLNNNLTVSNLKGFTGIPIYKGLEEEIHKVQEYVLNEQDKVYIIDSTASIYFVPLDIYNKDYDLFLIGNVGKEGIEEKVKELCNKDNVKILINSNVQNINWQMSKGTINYIIENKEKIGQVERFDIYE